MPRKYIVGGNWKCQPATQKEIADLLAVLNPAETLPADKVEVVCGVPDVFIPFTQSLLRKDFQIAGQNCCVVGGGAYTGETSAEMLCDLAVPWVILGHSERRHVIGGGETSEYIAAKVKYAMAKGLKVIYCVGEKLEEREAGTTEAVVAEQMEALLKAEITGFGESLVIAYEPVWAIGTGKVATPAQAQEVCAFIRKWVAEKVSAEAADATRIQYGGSVKGKNCDELAALPDCDGFLIGGASLKAEFIDCVNAFKCKI